MGLNPRGRGRGGKGRRGGGMNGPGPVFRGPPGMFGPPMGGFPPGPRPFGPPFFGGPCFSNFGPRRPPGYGKFPRKNFKARNQQRSNDSQNIDIDLSKPWVTEEIKNEEAKKQECLEIWRKSKDDNDWNKYKEQKQTVQNMYDKAKAEYLESKPEEAFLHPATQWKESQSYCEACDKTFKNERDLYLHEVEHETCGRDGCQYSAHPKLVAKHVKMQHDSGLFKRIGKLNTEEDVAKWLEERKRNYPTKKVVEEKKMMEEEKIKRGERINEEKGTFNKSFIKKKERCKRSTSFEKPAKDGRSRFRKKRKVKPDELTVLEALKEEESFRGSVPPFNGIRELYDIEVPAEEEKENFSDEEWEISNESESGSKCIKNVNNSLSILASCYDSDQDFCEMSKSLVTGRDNVSDNDSAPEEVKTVHVKEEESMVVEHNNNNNNNNDNNDNKRKRGNQCRTRRGRGKRGRKSDFGKENESGREKGESCSKGKRDLTLLEKLLSKEIRHERNVILQCVRYVIENNFFLNS